MTLIHRNATNRTIMFSSKVINTPFLPSYVELRLTTIIIVRGHSGVIRYELSELVELDYGGNSSLCYCFLIPGLLLVQSYCRTFAVPGNKYFRTTAWFGYTPFGLHKKIDTQKVMSDLRTSEFSGLLDTTRIVYVFSLFILSYRCSVFASAFDK